MKKVIVCAALLASTAFVGFVSAQEAVTPSGKPKAAPAKSAMKQSAAPAGGAESAGMAAPKPGEESKALGMFFAHGGTWTGKVPPGAVGPNSPEMTSHGTAMCHSMFGGFWYGCDVVDTMGSGKSAMTWRGHMVVGYDTSTKAYRSVVTDNVGTMAMFNGTLEGKKFVLETPDDVMMMGQMMKDRLTWDLSDGKTMKFTDEHKMGAGDWTMFESADMHQFNPAAPKAAAAPAANK